MAHITYLEVVAAANALIGEGAKPSIKAVRLKLKTGSPNTIQKFLTEWKATLSKPATAAPQLSAALTKAFAEEITLTAAKSRAEVEDQLVESEAAIADLAEAGELLEAERDMLTEKVEALIHERDTIAGQAAQQAIELATQAERITREQQAAESARIELAKVQIKTDDLKEKTGDQTMEIERLRATLDAQSAGRIAAEQTSAVQAARLESAADRVSKAEARVELLEVQCKDLGGELKIASIKSHEQQAEITATIRELSIAIRRADEASSAASWSDDVAIRANEVAAELQARMATMQQLLSDAQSAAKRADQEAAELREQLATRQHFADDAAMAA